MTDDLQLIDQLKKRINATIDQIKEAMITGAVDNMEKYKYMLGQAQAYTFISGEISNLLNKGAKNGTEDREGTVINLDGKDRNPKA